jgi:hypothetical protein
MESGILSASPAGLSPWRPQLSFRTFFRFLILTGRRNLRLQTGWYATLPPLLWYGQIVRLLPA